MKNMTSGFKKKAMVGTLALLLVFMGAVAGASAPSFSDWAKGALSPLIQKAAGWAGFVVKTNVDEETAAVKKKVNDEFTAAGNNVTNKTVAEVNKANKEVDDKSKALQTEIGNSATTEAAHANATIKSEIDRTKGSVDLDQVAKDELQKLIDKYAKSIPAAPTK